MKPEPQPEPWVWRAIFGDGSALDEYDAATPDGHGWAEVAQVAAARATRLTHIALLPTRAGLAAHCLAVGQAGAQQSQDSAVTARLFRRRSLTVSPLTGEEVGARPDPITVLALAWPSGPTAYTFFFGDGSVLVSDDLNAV